MKEILFATTNAGKLAELRALLAELPVHVLSLSDVRDPPRVEEDGATFAENARKKAEALRRRFGCVVVADDSGLCVDALGGRPGVNSARYAPAAADQDAANIERLLTELRGVPFDRRGAAFRCALCFATPGAEPLIVGAECRGVLTTERRGSGGFGYDPIFLVPELGRTFAELSAAEKNRLSHRGRAFERLSPHLRRWTAGG